MAERADSAAAIIGKTEQGKGKTGKKWKKRSKKKNRRSWKKLICPNRGGGWGIDRMVSVDYKSIQNTMPTMKAC